MGSGINTSIDMLGETTWGTKAAGTFVTVPFTGCDINLHEGTGTGSNMDTNPAPERVWRQGIWAAGTISGVPTYENLEPFLRGVIGSVGSSAGPPFTNTYDPAIAIPSYTIAVDADDRSGSTYYWTGCKIGSLSLNFPVDGPPSFSASVIGETEDGVAGAPTTPTVLSGVVIAPTDWVVWNIGDGNSDTASCVQSMSINFDWGLQPGSNCLGPSTASKEPLVTSKLLVTGSFTLSADDGSAWDLYKADTATTTIHLQAQGPTAASEDIEFTVGLARYTDGTGYNIGGLGEVAYTVNWAAYDNDATEPIEVVTINTVAAATDLTE